MTAKRWAVATALIAGLAAMPCFAKVPAGAGPDLHDLAALETFLDSYFNERMKELRIPGAAFVLVKDGKILFAKGYGYADLGKRAAVDPERTVFRVASVSKLFTATAVMQLAERGKIGLNDDVNKYLKNFQLERTFPAPVTVANLLTHTAGFDERYIGISARSESEIVPLGVYLARRMPPRVLPPGDTISYSNHGMALAGHLVEVISGNSFANYIEENILRPLGMEHSSFLLPPHLARALAVGYEYRRGDYFPVAVDYLDQVAPSGSLNATASDMARFMIAHLQLGRLDGTRILGETTAREMHRQQFTHHPRLPGFAYGFYEHSENRQRALSHGGSLRGFSSLLLLLPEKNLGFFAACNRQEPRLLQELASRFFDRYYPATETLPPSPVPGNFTDPIDRFEGNYRSVRYTRRTAEKLAVLLSQFQVTAGVDGILTVHYPKEAEAPTRWVRIEPLLFQRVDGEAYLAFRENEGRITHMFLQAYEFPLALEKLSWYEGARFQFGWLSFVLFCFLWAFIRWPADYLIHFRRRWATQALPSARWARVLAWFTCALNLMFFIAFALAFLDLPWLRLDYGMPRWLAALFVIPLLTTALAASLPVFAWLAWKNGTWSRKERIHFSIISLAALLFIPFLIYWNLLGFRF